MPRPLPADIDPAAILQRARPISSGQRAPTCAAALTGVDATGRPSHIPVAQDQGGAPWTVLVFVKADCLGCEPLWQLVAEPERVGPAREVRVVGLVRASDGEEAAGVRRLTGSGGTLVMGDGNWHTYRVQGPPFVAVVDGTAGVVAAEGVVWDHAQVRDLLGAARASTSTGTGPAGARAPGAEGAR